MDRDSLALRRWELVERLRRQSGELRVSELSEQLHVSRETIRRDVAALRRVGLPIEVRRRASEVCYAYDVPHVSSVVLTQDEQMALRRARSRFGPRHSPVADAVDRLLRDVSTFAEAEGAQADTPAADASKVLSMLRSALRAGTRIALTYEEPSPGPRRLRRCLLQPLLLQWIHGVKRLWGYVPGIERPRNFDVRRVRRVDLLQNGGATLEEWADERSFDRASAIRAPRPVDILVRLRPDVAHLLPRKRPAIAHRVERCPDGSLDVRARTTALTETRRWVLSWGDGAEVLSPPSLRRAIQTEVEAALLVYGRRPARRARPISGRTARSRPLRSVDARRARPE